MEMRSEMGHAIRLHERVYALINWLRDARWTVVLHFDEHHRAMNEFDAATRWLVRNQDVIPAELLPADQDREAFVNMLVSFGMTSEGAARRERKHPGIDGQKVFRSKSIAPNCCNCRFCADLVWRLGDRSWLRPQRDDKHGARLLKLASLRALVDEGRLPLLESDLERMLDGCERFDEESAIWAYACELVRRCRFDRNRLAYVHTGRGVLLLWRQIARDRNGRIPRDFRLGAERVFAARDKLMVELQAEVARELK
ncbi:MAG: hypothetical protein MI923_09460 [Phycisphaerales bacterium]|nr:hypothetical protein [Phycisphaerales bacterium]